MSKNKYPQTIALMRYSPTIKQTKDSAANRDKLLILTFEFINPVLYFTNLLLIIELKDDIYHQLKISS